MSRIYLLDSNVLIALANPDHTLHGRTRSWFHSATQFATCPITQSALVRYFMRNVPKPDLALAKSVLVSLTSRSNHHFWPDDASYAELPVKGITGHKQVTDAYLVLLANKHRGILATMDEALAAIHPGVFLV